MILPSFEGFKLVSGPSITSTVTVKNKKRKQIKTWKYVLRSVRSGKISIESPVFYKDGKEIKGKKETIKILESELSVEEQKELMYKAFIDDNHKLEGTFRYVLHEDFGYIEIFKNLKWEFYRRLTEEEIEKIKLIN